MMYLQRTHQCESIMLKLYQTVFLFNITKANRRIQLLPLKEVRLRLTHI